MDTNPQEQTTVTPTLSRGRSLFQSWCRLSKHQKYLIALAICMIFTIIAYVSMHSVRSYTANTHTPTSNSSLLVLIEPLKEDVTGTYFGKKIRQYLANTSDLKVVVLKPPYDQNLTQSVRTSVTQSRTLVIAGSSISDLPDSHTLEQYDSLVLLHPELVSETMLQQLNCAPAVYVLWGELHHSRERIFWQAYCARNERFKFVLKYAEGRELVDWMAYTVESIHQVNSQKQQGAFTKPQPHSAIANTTAETNPQSDVTQLETTILSSYTLLDTTHFSKQTQLPHYLEQNYHVIDCRSDLFYQLGHLPHAVNIPHTKLETTLEKINAHVSQYPKPIMIYSHHSSSVVTKEIAMLLTTRLKHKVSILEGGWQAWQMTKLPIDSEF